MKISLEWLSDYIDFDLSAQQVADMLSDLGFPCEGIEQKGDDMVIDAEITSNRGDCLGYIGIAREISAVTGKDIKMPQIRLDESEKAAQDIAQIQIDNPDLCGRYTGMIITDVKVGPSPDWLVKRLEAVGMRSVNNVVDATNYAMMETGQPPHAFDYKKITDHKIIVRRARKGEKLTSIDGTQCELDDQMLIIADSKGPIAIAGVMGGLDTEVSDTTTSILLEDAYFNPVTVRTTSRKLNLPSDAAFRFERSIDIENIHRAAKRTAQLITQLAGGKVAKGIIDIYPAKSKKLGVTLRLKRLKKLLGIEIPEETTMTILNDLGFNPYREDGELICTVPSWRRADVSREADLIEEVARVHGYDNIPTQKKIAIEVTPVDTREKLTAQIGHYLNSCGYYETVTVSFTDSATAELFSTDAQKLLSVKDVTRKSQNLLRDNLLGSLMGVIKTNLNARNTPCRIFEFADTYAPAETKDKLPDERDKLALASDGDFRQLKGAVEGLMQNLNSEAKINFEPAQLRWAQAGAEIFVNGKYIGWAGVVSEKVRGHFDFKEALPVAAQLDLQTLSEIRKEDVEVKPLPRFPAIDRDLSIIVDEQVSWAQIGEAIKETAPAILQDINFIEIYRGKGIEKGKKSVTLSLRFRDEDGTLTHETVDSYEAGIIKNLNEKTAAQLRTA